MRHYSTDSPQAVARLLAMTILADGGLDAEEMNVLKNHDLSRRIGLDDAEFDRVLQEFCNDVMLASEHSGAAQLGLDRDTTAQLLRDVRSPELQRRLLRVMLDIVDTDGTVTGGESMLLAEAMMTWGVDLHHHSLSSTPSASPHIVFGRRSGESFFRRRRA